MAANEKGRRLSNQTLTKIGAVRAVSSFNLQTICRRRSRSIIIIASSSSGNRLVSIVR